MSSSAVADVAVAQLGGNGKAFGIKIDLDALSADIGRATDRALLGGCLVSGIAGLDVDVAGFPGDAVGFRQLFRSQRRRLRDAFPIESACLVSSR